MIKIIFLILSVLFFSACSIKTPKNDWQLKSTTAFNSYTKNFLQSNDALAASDLSRAVMHAKQSADLTQLATIYLGECALNTSVGITDNCRKYQTISSLIQDKKLDAYYALLTQIIQKEQIKILPLQYQKFAQAIKSKEFLLAKQEVQNMTKPSSLFLSGALLKKELDLDTKNKIINIASLHGYKKIILFWLKELKKSTTDLNEKQNIEKKISILSLKH